MKTFFLMISILLLATSSVHAGSLFKWIDKDGKVHYGDKPAEDAVAAEQKKFSATGASGDDELPYGVRKAKQDFPVTLYVTEKCGEPCVQAQSFLNKRGIPYTEKNLLTAEEFDAFKATTGSNGVPALTVGKTVLKGYEAGQWNSELDIAGYPKIAPYGARSKPPLAAKPVQPVNPEAAVETEQ
jgi:glutaredoxin